MRNRVWLIAAVAVVATAMSVSAQNYVIAASNAEESNNVYYKVGLIKKDGVDWGIETRLDDGVNKPSIATDDGVAVLVYAEDKEIFYRVGQIDAKALTVEWGPALELAKGRNPMASMAGTQVVIAYRGTSKNVLYVMSGRANGARKQVIWGESQKYDDKGRSPVVAAGSLVSPH